MKLDAFVAKRKKERLSQVRDDAQIELTLLQESRDFYPGQAATRCPNCGCLPRIEKRVLDSLSIQINFTMACRCLKMNPCGTPKEALRVWNVYQALNRR